MTGGNLLSLQKEIAAPAPPRLVKQFQGALLKTLKPSSFKVFDLPGLGEAAGLVRSPGLTWELVQLWGTFSDEFTPTASPQGDNPQNMPFKLCWSSSQFYLQRREWHFLLPRRIPAARGVWSGVRTVV